MTQMTKAEARAWLRRSREGIAWANDAIKRGDLDDLREAMVEITGAAVAVQAAAEGGEFAEFDGIAGVS